MCPRQPRTPLRPCDRDSAVQPGLQSYQCFTPRRDDRTAAAQALARTIQALRKAIQPPVQRISGAFSEVLDKPADRVPLRCYQRRRSRWSRRTRISRKIAQREIGFMAHGADDGNGRRSNSPGQRLIVERP